MKKEIVAYFTEDNKIKSKVFDEIGKLDQIKQIVKHWKEKYVANNEKLSFAKGSYLYDKISEIDNLNLFTPIYREYELYDIGDIEFILKLDQNQKSNYTLDSNDSTFGKNWINKDWEVGLNGDIHPKSREIVFAIRDYVVARQKINKFLEIKQ